MLAEFGAGERVTPGVELVPLAPDSPMRREWAVVCDAPDLPVAMTAWELPGQVAVPDRSRVFETIWTVDAGGRARRRPGLRRGGRRTPAPPVPGRSPRRSSERPLGEGIDTVSVTAMFNRMVAYVDTFGASR